MLFNIFLGCSVFFTTNFSLLYASHLLVRRFLPHAPSSASVVAIGLLFYSFIIIIFQALSPFHAITKTGVTVSCLLLALACHFKWGKKRDLEADFEPVRSWIRDGLASRWAVLLIVCGFVVLLSFSRALLMPPLAWDCLTYHLTFAALWIKKGTLLLFNAPDQIHICAHLPINGEMFAAWLLLPFCKDLMVNTMNFPIILLGGISCYAIARELGLTRKEAGFAPALICFAPVIYSPITTAYVDSATFAFCSASALFTLRYLRGGLFSDNFLALAAAGILLGIKYTVIPIVALIFIAVALKTIFQVSYGGFFKKLILVLLGLIILGTFGGRQYIRNTIEAGNPLYPLPLTILNHKIAEGWSKAEQVNTWVSQYEKKYGGDTLSWWEREYRKFCYKPLRWWDRGYRESGYPSLTAGPKFLLFLILAGISLFMRPRHVTKGCWYFLSILWIVPIVLFYADTSASAARRGYWADECIRFLSPSLALFTTQGLVVVKKMRRYFRQVDFFLVALISWDLLYVNKTHSWEVELRYPLVVVMIPLLVVLFWSVRGKLKLFSPKEKTLASSTGIPKGGIFTLNRGMVGAVGFICLVGGLYLLQSYRDNTRYAYYRGHSDLGGIPRTLVGGWEFLDQPEEKKTIAMTVGWSPPGHNWFFYPLLGRWQQNEIVYISARHRGEIPTRVHQGLLRGDDFSTWHYNLRKEKVDYIFVAAPWPIELGWMLQYRNEFQLVFSEKYCRIFKYTGGET